MHIGIPREIKIHEYRVGLTPAACAELMARGHQVRVERGAGEASGYEDADYESAGAQLLDSAVELYELSELIVKVKEPQAGERALLHHHHTLFTYLHLAADREQTLDLLASGATCIAYETVTDSAGRLPLLAPMSEVAGRMATQVGAACLQKAAGGRGVLLGGVPGVAPARVVILGGGVAGSQATRIAVGMGADVRVLDSNLNVLRQLDQQFAGRLTTLYASRHNIEQQVSGADLVIGCVLIPGASAPKLISAELVSRMQKGAVLVDIAIDQGGCAETSRPTSHAEPTYLHDGVVHYCVTNMPGAVARTATQALTNATLPFVLALADKGPQRALYDDPCLRNGLNIAAGHLTCQKVAEAHQLAWVSAASLLGLPD